MTLSLSPLSLSLSISYFSSFFHFPLASLFPLPFSPPPLLPLVPRDETQGHYLSTKLRAGSQHPHFPGATVTGNTLGHVNRRPVREVPE